MPPPRPVMERAPRRGDHWYRSPVRLSQWMLDLCQQVSGCRMVNVLSAACGCSKNSPRRIDRQRSIFPYAIVHWCLTATVVRQSKDSTAKYPPSCLLRQEISVIAANCVLRPRRRRRTRPRRRCNSRCGCRSRCCRCRRSGCWSWCRSRCRCGSHAARQGINVSPATTRPD